MIPNDPEAERALIGGCLAFPDALGDCLAAVDETDFYDPALAKLWTAMRELHRQGIAVDHVTMPAAFTAHGWELEPHLLLELKINGLRPRPEHMEIIVRHSAARQIMKLGTEAANEMIGGADPYKHLDQLKVDIGLIGTPVGGRAEARTLDDVIDTAEFSSPWTIPGMLRRDWRAIVVASEGSGKSTLLRQIAACSAQGVHPLKFVRIEPVRVLLVDLENPAAAIAETGRDIVKQLRLTTTDRYDPERMKVFERPGGIDIRGRHDRAELEREIVAHRPDLVVMGPVYKMSHKLQGESYEEEAEPVLRILDDLRTRHRFGLILEHHAPQGNHSGRTIRPFGSQRWLAWPELGIGLERGREGPNMIVRRWRGDRLQNDWPDELTRDQVWPWTGIWRNPTSHPELARSFSEPLGEPF